MIENVIEKIIENPDHYNVVISNDDTTAYNKEDGDTHKFGEDTESVLIDLLTALGCEVERL